MFLAVSAVAYLIATAVHHARTVTPPAPTIAAGPPSAAKPARSIEELLSTLRNAVNDVSSKYGRVPR